MLTRIEISGFKTFSDFALDVPPFVVVVGLNAAGKSNLFDALELLARLAERDLATSFVGLRGEPFELFRRSADGSIAPRMDFAVEVLLEDQVRDPWGGTVDVKHNRVRYELSIERRFDHRKVERLFVVNEQAIPIVPRQERWHPTGVSGSSSLLRYGRRSPFLTTSAPGGKPEFNIHQDGHAGRRRPASAAEASVLSTITSADFPHLFALREELRSWRYMQVDPASMRRPSSTTAPELLEPNAANLATVLARIRSETSTTNPPKGVLADITADLAAVIPGLQDVEVIEDRSNREYRIDVTMRDEAALPSRVLSDGTLRVLAVLTMLHDPKRGGLLCFEEPENGIHPAWLSRLIEILRERARTPSSGARSARPYQLIMNSHSPVVLSHLAKGEMLFADTVRTTRSRGEPFETRTRIRPVRPLDEGELPLVDRPYFVDRFEVEHYLRTVTSWGEHAS